MTTCAKCNEIIGPSAPVYKASRGFVSKDGTFYEDEGIIFHMECHHSYEPFEELEYRIKNS